MTTFTKQFASGNSGEFYVSYKISTDLEFPVRLLSSDIGIDGEYELLDGNKKSNGQIVRFQVKTIKEEFVNNKSFEIEKHHEKYWNDFIQPVIFFLFARNSEKLYFKLLTPFAFTRKDSKIYVPFTQDDLYTKEKLTEATEKYGSSNFNLTKRVLDLKDKIEQARNTFNVEKYSQLEEDVRKLEVIINELYWGSNEESERLTNTIWTALNKFDRDISDDFKSDLY